ncbi:MAG: GNAT family N-acetyltransferase [Candidatus Thiodiazotropha sp.]|jgi:putative acetyltransferase
MRVREYCENDYHEIADLFHASVHAIDNAAYSSDDLEAWAPSEIDYNHWKDRLALKKPYVAVKNDMIAGFIELENSGHIDCLYVHPSCWKQGVATQLLDYALRKAKEKGIDRVFVEVSEVAKPLFVVCGFRVISENKVQRRGRELINYKMDFHL